MIYTSYFAKLKSLPDNIIPISICGKAPAWYNGLQYKKLAPTYNTLIKYKNDHNEDDYIKSFKEKTLSGLDAMDTIFEIYNLLPEKEKFLIEMVNCAPWNNRDINIALICYEKPEDFCHRHLVADWLKERGFHVEEWRTT